MDDDVLLASLAVALLGLDGVHLVADVAEIPGRLPAPVLPAPAMLLEMLPAAGAVALIGLVEQIAKPATAALLIVAAFAAIRFGEIYDVWHTSLASRLVMVVTFGMTLALPVEQAVAVGLVLSAEAWLAREAQQDGPGRVPWPDGISRAAGGRLLAALGLGAYASGPRSPDAGRSCRGDA
jgi:MFS superfamily sulfate permease-like transporter